MCGHPGVVTPEDGNPGRDPAEVRGYPGGRRDDRSDLLLRLRLAFQHELLRAFAAALREIVEQSLVGEIELVRVLPVVLRDPVERLDDVVIVQLDRELAPAVEAAG